MAPPLDGLVHLALDVPDVRRWSAEQPNRYALRVVLRAPDGAVAEATTVQVGFRRVEIAGSTCWSTARGSSSAASTATTSTSTPGGSSRRVDARRPRA